MITNHNGALSYFKKKEVINYIFTQNYSHHYLVFGSVFHIQSKKGKIRLIGNLPYV